MSTVQVLCPNGRRQNVKITPNTKLLQVLEEVCKKQGFLPSEDYNLIHGRKTLDVTLSVRYANLPNNCKLELVKAEKSRVEQEVVIALQLENGERLQDSFLPTITLWDLLLHWESKADSLTAGELTNVDASSTPPKHPVCIYMREEVIGEMALKSTSLRKLGLTSGKAAIRFSKRPVEDGVIAEISSKLEKELAKNARLEQIAARQISQSDSNKESNMSQNKNEPEKTPDISQKPDVQSFQNEPNEQSISESNSKDTSKQLSKQSENETNVSNSEPMETDNCDHVTDTNMDVDKTTSNEQIVTPGSRRLQQNDTGQVSQTEASRRSAEALRNMNLPGVEVITPDDFYDLTAREQQVARQMAAAYMEQMGLDINKIRQGIGTQRPPQRRPAQPQSFQEFKFPEETKGKDLYKNEISSANKEDFKPCDRETLLFSMDEDVQSDRIDEDLPEDFFEVTEKDVRKMFNDLQKNVENDEPLMTQAMRRAKLEEQYSKYERVVIRIQFPDKLVLQGLFRPRETVFAIKKYVKSYLEDKDINFYLYTAPPKQVLKDNSANMIEAKLVPATVVYFGVSDENKVSEHYLSKAVLNEVGARIKADEVVSKCFPSEYTESDSVQSSSKSGKSSASQQVKRSSDDRPRQPRDNSGQQPGVPKWFKMGKK